VNWASCELLRAQSFLQANAQRYFEAAKLYKKLGNPGAALRFARKGLVIDENCVGVDNSLYKDRLDKLKELESVVT